MFKKWKREEEKVDLVESRSGSISLLFYLIRISRLFLLLLFSHFFPCFKLKKMSLLGKKAASPLKGHTQADTSAKQAVLRPKIKKKSGF